MAKVVFDLHARVIKDGEMPSAWQSTSVELNLPGTTYFHVLETTWDLSELVCEHCGEAFTDHDYVQIEVVRDAADVDDELNNSLYVKDIDLCFSKRAS